MIFNIKSKKQLYILATCFDHEVVGEKIYDVSTSYKIIIGFVVGKAKGVNSMYTLFILK